MRQAFGLTLYSIAEAAEMLGASPQRLHAMRRAGILAAHPLKDTEGKSWQYYVTEAAIRAAFDTPAPPPAKNAPPPPAETPATIEARDRAARELCRRQGVKCR